MGVIEAIILGVVQGLTEFLPVSSSGHLILVREFFGFEVGYGLAFDAVLHFATALAVAAYFWKDILRLSLSFFKWISRTQVSDEDKTMVVAIAVATIPAVALGLFLEEIMETMFRNSLVVVVALVVGSLVMLRAERMYKLLEPVSESAYGKIMTWKKALAVGLFQSLALIPGMSRSGMAISGGMFMGLSREESARFAFLLAVPLLLGAGAKKGFELGQSGAFVSDAQALAAGAAGAFIVGILVVHYLLKFLRTHSLMVFVWYRLAFATLVLIFVLV
jgi:undecaprenyl-diphosphatase